MNRKRLPLLALALCLLAASCKKNEQTSGNADYTRLKPGNYWIYQSYFVDASGNASPGSYGSNTIYYDSVYVEKDTMINGYLWHKLMTPDALGSSNYQPSYVRDSLLWVVGLGGQMILAPVDYKTVFRSNTVLGGNFTMDSAVRWQLMMADKDKVIQTPAGVFNTIAMAVHWTFYPYAAQRSAPYTRSQYTRYAAGVGMVSQTMPFYVSIPSYEERRLIRYHVR